MSQVWSEINKVVNVLDPASQSGTSGTAVNTDVVDMENYKKCTFLVHTGAVALNKMAITAYANDDNATSGSAITFRYRTQIAGTGGNSATSGSDVPSALSTGSSITTTTGAAGGMYIIEVDAPTVAAAGTDYDHTYLKFTTQGSYGTARLYGVVAVLSEPRYPQAILDTAIG